MKLLSADELEARLRDIGSRRYHRGRIVQVLRELPAGESMRVSDLGERRELVHQLAADGLVRIDADERVRLAD